MSRLVVGEYEKKCEDWTRFQTDSQFDFQGITLSDAHYETQLQGFI
jgi:hypothetical protein